MIGFVRGCCHVDGKPSAMEEAVCRAEPLLSYKRGAAATSRVVMMAASRRGGRGGRGGKRGGRGGGRGGRRSGGRGAKTGGGGGALTAIPSNMDPTEAVRRQVEFYFCQDNLQTDQFLKKSLDEEGFCKLSVIATFSRVRAFTSQAKSADDPRTTEELVAEALVGSPFIEVVRKPTGLYVRRMSKYSVDEIGGGVTLTVSKAPASSAAREEKGAPCKYFFAGYCDRGNHCPFTHNMDYCEAIEAQWIRPIGSGPSTVTEPLVRNLKDTARRLGLLSPSLSYASSLVSSFLPDSIIKERSAQQVFDYFVIVDLEGQHEIIEFPAIIFDARSFREVGRFHRWVRPVKLWQGKRINPESNSVSFSQVLKEFDRYLRSLKLLGTGAASFALVCCGDWDVATQIPKQCKICGCSVPSYMTQWINIKDVFNRVYVSRTKASGMRGMLQRMGIVDKKGNIEGVHHLGMHDTENITRVLLRLLEEETVVDITGRKKTSEGGSRR